MRHSKLKTCAAGVAALLLTVGAQAQMTVPAGGSMVVPPGGSLGLACTALDVQGDFQLNSGQVNSAGGVSIGTAGALDGGTGTINVSGNWNNTGTFVAGTGSVTFGNGCAPGPIVLSGNTVFNNLTLGGGGQQYVIPAGSHIRVNGVLTLQGTPGNPIQLVSSGSGTAMITLGPSAQVVRNNSNVNTNVLIGLPQIEPVPTLGEWALFALALAMGLMACLRRQRLS